MQYRAQNCCQQSSYNQPPHVSYYLGSDAPLPARPNIKLNNSGAVIVPQPTEPPTPVDGRFVKDLQIKDTANESGWVLNGQTNDGSLVFGDRDYTYLDVPAQLQGAETIQTACNSKNTDADLAQFKAGEKIDVYIALDQRVEQNAAVPQWIGDYTKTGMTVKSSNDVVFDLYKKTFNSGETVSLGTNGMKGTVVNYTVFVTAAAAEATQPSEPSGNTLWGDANCNGDVDLSDAVAILAYVANPQKNALSAQGLLNADVVDNGTSGVTGIDALAIQMIDAALIKADSDLPISYAALTAKLN